MCAIWFITTVTLASLLFQNSVEKSDMANKSSDMKNKKGTMDKIVLGSICFNLSCIFTTAVLQVYIQCREIIKLRHSMDIDAEKYNRKLLMTKDWLHEIKETAQDVV